MQGGGREDWPQSSTHALTLRRYFFPADGIDVPFG